MSEIERTPDCLAEYAAYIIGINPYKYELPEVIRNQMLYTLQPEEERDADMSIAKISKFLDADPDKPTGILTVRHEDFDGIPIFITAALQKEYSGWELRYFKNTEEITDDGLFYDHPEDIADAFRIAQQAIPDSYDEEYSAEGIRPRSFLWLAEYDEKANAISVE